MKFIIVLTAVLGLTFAAPPPPPTSGLAAALKYIDALLPWQEVEALFTLFENDPEVQQVSAYLNSPNFLAFMKEVRNMEDIQLLEVYLRSQGVDVEGFARRLLSLFGIQLPRSTSVRAGGMRQLVDELKKVFKFEEVAGIVRGLKAANADFKRFIDLVGSKREVVQNIREHPEIQHIAAELRRFGIDTNEIVRLIELLFGWE